MIVIPAIDIIDGKCVRLSRGDFNSRTTYTATPLDTALKFQDAGLTHLHIVDLDGARNKQIVNYRILEEIATHTDLTIDYGGGIKSTADLRIVLGCGAAMATIGSIAVKDQDLMEEWIRTFGAEHLVLGADVRDGMVSVNGWACNSGIKLHDLLDTYIPQGVNNVMCTDINKDGLLQGPSLNLYSDILSEYPGINLMASGGISSVDDIKRLKELGVPAVVIGKAYYEGRIGLKELALINES